MPRETRDVPTRDSAVLSDCGLYRYRLERHTGLAGRVAAGIMVNPSTADAQIDDQTIKKWNGFAGRLGIGRFISGNKFALRATDVRELRRATAPIGPDSDAHREQILRDADLHVAAWGRWANCPGRCARAGATSCEWPSVSGARCIASARRRAGSRCTP